LDIPPLPNVCTGRPPFQITYNVAKIEGIGAIEPLDQLTFTSIQHRTRFQLRTSTVGRIVYEVKQIGDAAYPLSKDGTILSWSDRLLFEQQVMQRPNARFKSLNRLSYCLHDTLTSHGSASTDGIIILEGTPPFIVNLSIKSLASSEVQTKEVQVYDKVWKLDVPSYTFKSKGPHLIKIESIQDKFRCEQSPFDPSAQSLWVDVAEIAAIIPIDRKEDFCVGDVAQFQLEGIPPWTIGSVSAMICLSCTLNMSVEGFASTASRTSRKRRHHLFLYYYNSPGNLQ
jgi:nucleoporin POM152